MYTNTILLKLTKEQKEKLKRLADSVDLSMSAYIRRWINREDEEKKQW